jgi:hypothetical protein
MRFLYEVATTEGPVAYVVYDPEKGTELVVPDRPDLAETITADANHEYSPADGCPDAHLANTAARWLGGEARPVNPWPPREPDSDVQY